MNTNYTNLKGLFNKNIFCILKLPPAADKIICLIFNKYILCL